VAVSLRRQVRACRRKIDSARFHGKKQPGAA